MTTGPFPSGTVLRYSYLWAWQKQKGEESGRKDRPVCVHVIVPARGGSSLSMLFPITSQPPREADVTLQIPAMEARRAGIDIPAWIVVNEWNEDDLGSSFHLADLSPLGAFSKAFMKQIRELAREAILAGRHRRVDRR